MKNRFAIILILLALTALSSLCAHSLSADNPLAQKLKGRILLQVEAEGEAWYVFPADLKRYFLGRPEDALNLMKNLGLGVSDKDLNKIAPAQASSDAALPDQALAKRLAGQILLQVEKQGQAWYVNPTDLKRYYLGRPADALALMRRLGLGVTNADLAKIQELIVKKEDTNDYLVKNYTIVKTAELRTYSSTDGTYSFDYPAAWKMKKFADSPNQLQLSDASRDFIAEKKGVISIHKLTTDSATDLADFKIAVADPQVKTLSQQTFTVADQPARLAAYTYPLASQKTVLIQLDQKNFLRVSLTTAKANYSAYERIFDALIRSFEIKSPSAN